MRMISYPQEYFYELLPKLGFEDIDLCFRTDSVDEAFDYLTEQLGTYAMDQPGATL